MADIDSKKYEPPENMNLITKKIPRIIFLLISILIVSYLIGMVTSSSFNNIRHFTSTLVMDTAQIARNTARGNFLITKSILPVGYSFFPTITDHPDFIRYPFHILIYSVLFFVFSPSVIILKLFGFILYLLNGILIFLIVTKFCQSVNIHPFLTQKNNIHIVALLTAVSSSIFFPQYFRSALSGDLEIINYSLLLSTMLLILDQKIKPVALGCLFGLLYLARPNLLIFVAIFSLYLLISRYARSEWIGTGLKYFLGFSIVISPFVIRSLLLTGEPLFNLNSKVDIIKDIDANLSHDNLYKTFSLPPSLMSVVSQDFTFYFQRWTTGVARTIRYLFDLNKLIYWAGLGIFFYLFKKYRGLVLTYLVFLIIHTLVVSNIIKTGTIPRVYALILFFITLLGVLGFSLMVLTLLDKLFNNKVWISIFSTLFLISIPVVTLFLNLGNGISFRSPISPNDISAIRKLNLPCIYTTIPTDTAWYLDIPSIYKPIINESMLTDGPKECNHVFVRGYEKVLDEFLMSNGELVYQSKDYQIFQLNKP